MSEITPAAEPIGVVWRLGAPEAPAAAAASGSIQFALLDAGAVPGVAQALGYTEATLRERLASGRRGYLARIAGQTAAIGWVSFKEEPVGELGLRVRLLPNEAYIWDCLTHPDFRGRGLYTGLLAHTARALLAEGVRTIWIGAAYTNHPSQAGIARAGFTAISDLVVAPPQPGERRQQAWLAARPGISPAQLADFRRVYLDGRETVWLFGEAD